MSQLFQARCKKDRWATVSDKERFIYKEVEGRMESLKRTVLPKKKRRHVLKDHVTFNVDHWFAILLGVIFNSSSEC